MFTPKSRELNAEELPVCLAEVDDPSAREKYFAIRKGDDQIKLICEIASLKAMRYDDAHASRTDVAGFKDIQESVTHDLNLYG